MFEDLEFRNSLHYSSRTNFEINAVQYMPSPKFQLPGKDLLRILFFDNADVGGWVERLDFHQPKHRRFN